MNTLSEEMLKHTLGDMQQFSIKFKGKITLSRNSLLPVYHRFILLSYNQTMAVVKDVRLVFGRDFESRPLW